MAQSIKSINRRVTIYVKGREKVYYYIIELTLLFLIKNGLQQILTVEGCIFFNYFLSY